MRGKLVALVVLVLAIDGIFNDGKLIIKQLKILES